MKTKRSKRFKNVLECFEKDTVYSLAEAVDILKKSPAVKFDQSVEVSLKCGIDVQKSDQQIRGSVSLPNGTGKDIEILVFAKGEKAEEAKKAGATYVGGEELLEKVKGGWTKFDVVVATLDMMKEVGKLGKILGPRGLMPNPKDGTLTNDVVEEIKKLKKGKLVYKNDKRGVINSMVGKLSFGEDMLIDNIKAFVKAIVRSRPATAKGDYLISLAVSSTMGPGLRVEISSI